MSCISSSHISYQFHKESSSQDFDHYGLSHNSATKECYSLYQIVPATSQTSLQRFGVWDLLPDTMECTCSDDLLPKVAIVNKLRMRVMYERVVIKTFFLEQKKISNHIHKQPTQTINGRILSSVRTLYSVLNCAYYAHIIIVSVSLCKVMADRLPLYETMLHRLILPLHIS